MSGHSSQTPDPDQPGNQPDDFRQAALDYHRLAPAGKIKVAATKPMVTQRELALAYSPGVAYACEEIAANPGLACPCPLAAAMPPPPCECRILRDRRWRPPSRHAPGRRRAAGSG